MRRENKVYSTIIVILAYVISIVAGLIFYLYLIDDQGTYIALLGADILATIVIFAFSFFFRNSSIYDPYWSFIPLVILLGLAIQLDHTVFEWSSQAALFWITFYWSNRLTHNWYRGWKNLNHEDWRYGMLRKENPKTAIFVDFSGVHIFPTLIVYLALLPAIWNYINGTFEMNLVNWIGLIAFAIAMVYETIGDNQLRAYLLSKPEKSEFLRTGLWKHTRHPNYFGEALFWWSIYLVSWNSEMPWWYIVCPLSITSMFVFITGPMMDKRMCKSRPDYKEHIRRTSGIIPWFVKS